MNYPLHQKAADATTYRSLSVGLDIGNSTIKLCLDSQECRIPSYFLPLHSPLLEAPAAINGGLVEYIDGDRKDLINQRWLAGEPAYIQSPGGALQVSSSPKNKIDYSLQMLLGAIASLRHQPQWDITIVVSVPTADQSRSALTDALRGNHTVRFNDAHLATIGIDSVMVADEGQGVIFEARTVANTRGQILLYDFGYGTTILTLFNRGKKVQRHPMDTGVKALVGAIATHDDTLTRLNTAGDPQLIMQGIERGDFIYGKPERQASWRFENAYREELKPWVQSVLAQAIAFGRKWSANSDAILATGGGSQLPLVKELLLANDISPVPEGCRSNARGLARIAFEMQRRAK